LASHASFSFQGRSGRMSVLKEARQRGAGYWYAYRSHGRHTMKRYLGRTSDLSLARLEEAAHFLESLSSSQQHPLQPNREIALSQPAPRVPRVLHAQPPSSESLLPLLISKLSPPRLPVLLVERARLLARLDTGCSHTLTLLLAPAGFGKTILVNQWIVGHHAQPPFPAVAWVSLDGGDNDLLRFWRSVITACQTVQERLGQAALALFEHTMQPPYDLPPLEVALTLLLNDLSRQEQDGLLILDDYHVITEPHIHEALTFFIDHLPTKIHVLLLSRSRPPLPLLRWQARGDLYELHAADLRFSLEETTEFLRQMLPTPLSEAALMRLDAFLEGWAAGLRLLALRLQGQLALQMTPHEVEDALLLPLDSADPSSLHQPLLDYCVVEILQKQPEPLMRFLLQTSGLSLLTVSLCDAVTGSENSAALLEAVEEAGLFLEVLNGEGGWYRYHALFAETMRREAARRLGEKALDAVSLRASYWYEQHVLPMEAIEAALYAHDPERAGLLIEHYGATGQRYELHTLRRWLAQIPDAVLYAHPALCLYSAITFQFLQGTSPLPETMQIHIEEMLQRAEEGWRSQGNLLWIGLIFAFRALIASLDGHSQAAVENARKALALLLKEGLDDQDDPRPDMLEWRTICLGIVGLAEMHQGRFGEAWRFLREALVYSEESSNKPFLREISLRMGTVCIALGELHQAGEYYRQALSSGRLQEEDSEDTVQALLGLAQLSLEWNDLDASEQRTSEALELTRRCGQEWSERAAYLLALLHAARGQTTSAELQLAVLLARLQAVSTPHAQELLPDALALQVRLQLATGDLLAAQRNLALLTQNTQALSFTQHMMANILQARLQFAQDNAHEALSLLAHLLPIAQEKRHIRSELEIQVLLALVFAADKQKDEAQQWLQRALFQARTKGFLRPFLDEGERLIPLLRSLMPTIHEKKALYSYAQGILHALTTPGKVSPLTLSPGNTWPLEPLSAQEQRVLRLLSAGCTNPEIARELVISVNTVKDHVKHLYRKLNVSNRLEAREAARHLERS
jgi:LuxR family maltose regulon positive regulatory protein